MSGPRDHTSQLYKKFFILPFSYLLKYNCSKYIYKVLNNITPAPTHCLFRYTQHRTVTRSQTNNLLHLPKYRLTLCKNSIFFEGVKNFNCIPLHIRNSDSLSNFTNTLFNFYLNT